MAKTWKISKNESEKTVTKEGPSPYGSHASMIDKEMTANLKESDKWVVLKDELGHYLTERSRLDSGIADPYRYEPKQRKKPAVNKVLEENHGKEGHGS